MIRSDGKLVDVDTAEVSALPEGFSSKTRPSTSGSESISRPTSAASMRIRIDKPSAEAIKIRSMYTRPINAFEGEQAHLGCH